ncbi:MAG: alpha-amylase [Candidatus Heimdallarchaeota archaeon]|nr:MAG: alpha-amylase [Candidatus Heimdallarchaeota archaeon]
MEKKKWWQKAVFYQIYPRSFADSNNNGIGDLQGVIERLDYLQELGIDAIWFSPFFSSPQKDFGYDISDYRTIDPGYGTMKDFEELLEKAHSLDIKIILDMVLNHTSDEHPWFLESRSNTTNPKRDWYIWRKGRGKKQDKPPNNWRAVFGGNAWKWDKYTQEYFFHQFLPFQPDLNWRNSAVQEEMLETVRFWVEKGVDGFRLDIIHTLFEDKDFRDNPRSWRLLPSSDSTAYLFQNPKYTAFLPETINMCIHIRSLIDSYVPERMVVGEVMGGPRIFRPLYGENNNGLNLVFNFKFSDQSFSAKKFFQVIQETESILSDPYWPCYVFSNHDKTRMISRVGNNEKKAKLLTLLLLTVRGTPFIYYGEEIGMHQGKIPKEALKDPLAKLKVMGIPIGKFLGRDGCRTPMQWDNSSGNAGFSPKLDTIPWLPISTNSDVINVENQKNDEKSMLSYFKQLIHLRKSENALCEGKLLNLSIPCKNCLTFERLGYQEGKLVALLVIFNFNNKLIQIQNPYPSSTIIFSTESLNLLSSTTDNITIQAYEGLLTKFSFESVS